MFQLHIPQKQPGTTPHVPSGKPSLKPPSVDYRITVLLSGNNNSLDTDLENGLTAEQILQALAEPRPGIDQIRSALDRLLRTGRLWLYYESARPRYMLKV